MSRWGKNVAVPRKGDDVGCHTEIGGPDIQHAHDRARDQNAHHSSHWVRPLHPLVDPGLRAVGPPEDHVREGVHGFPAGIG